MPVMSWEEHAERSLWKQHFDPDHWPHVLTRVMPPESEMMLRMDCQGCPGQVWAAWHPAVDQGMSIDNLVSFVEGIINGDLRSGHGGQGRRRARFAIGDASGQDDGRLPGVQPGSPDTQT